MKLYEKMKNFIPLKAGDLVEIIAPSSPCSYNQLSALKQLLESWQLNCIVKKDIFAKDLLCANSDEMRATHLKNALLNPSTKAIICARGGYGSMRLIPELAKMQPPRTPKIFVGMSDTTCLHLYFQQEWGWATIHGAAASDRFSKESIASLKSLLFAEDRQIHFNQLTPLNKQAQSEQIVTSSLIGGNLTLIQAGIGTSWQMNAKDKIILLEEIDERAYRIDRMLEHLQQAKIFKNAAAILLADFLGGKEPDGSSLVNPVLERFAEQSDIPVVKIENIGHGYMNLPIPLGTKAQLHLGKKIQLQIES